MAGDGERRMLFDTRGRRRNVIRVVYGVLALLMGASLFLTVGPFNLGELAGGGGSSNAEDVFEEQAERIEGRLAKDPTNEALLLALTRTRISAGNAQTEIDPQTGAPGAPPPEASIDFNQALLAWKRYLKEAGDEPNPAAAQLVAQTFFSLAEKGSFTLGAIESNTRTAAEAQRIAAAERPNVGSLSSLAIYEFFNGNFAAGDKAMKRAAALAPTKAEAQNIEKQLVAFRKRGQQYVKSLEQFAKAEQKSGQEQLQNPFGPLGSGGAGLPPAGE